MELLPMDEKKFTGKSGDIKINLKESAHAYEYFFLLFTNDVMSLIMRETNRYAEQQINKIPTDNSSNNNNSNNNKRKRTVNYDWTPIDQNELYLYMSSLFYAGVVRLSSWQDYFSKLEYGQPFFSDMFTVKRWFQIHRYLHFADNTKATSDPIYKIRELSEYLKNKLKTLIDPHEYITVDECIVPFKGKVKIRQYIPRKPHTTGIKIFLMNDGNGFLWKCGLYLKKKRSFQRYDQGKNDSL